MLGDLVLKNRRKLYSNPLFVPIALGGPQRRPFDRGLSDSTDSITIHTKKSKSIWKRIFLICIGE